MADVDGVPGEVALEDVRRRSPDPAIVIDLQARHGQAMFGFVRGLGMSEDQASDCVQEVLLRLWAELRRGTWIDDPKGWAFRSVYRLAMDQHRLRRRVAGLVTLLARRSSLDPGTGDAADRIAVWSEVDRLPKRQRDVLYLRYRADMPYDEIGRLLGMTTSTARSHATQGMATLRRRLVLDEREGAR